MEIKESLDTKRDFISDLKEFPHKLKQRNPVFYYLGNVLLAIFFLFLIGSAVCNYTLYQLCHWLKPGKFSFSFALYVFTMGWFFYYLKDTLSDRTIKILTWLITFIVSTEMLAMFTQSWMSSDSYLALNIPPANSEFIFKKLTALSNALVLANTFITIFVARVFFRPIKLSPKEYLWAIRAGFVIFNISCVLGIVMLKIYGQQPIDPNSLNLPFTELTVLRNNLLSMHFFGIHVMQIIPLAVYYFHDYFGKKFVVSTAVLYSLGSILLLLQLSLHLIAKTGN